MRKFTDEIRIAASPARVWDVLSDVERWREWTPSILGITPLDGVSLGIGSRVRIQQPNFPPSTWTIESWEPGRGFSWSTQAPGCTVVADHRITPILSDCRVDLVLQFGGLLGGLVGWRYGDATRRHMGLEVKGLKERSERPA